MAFDNKRIQTFKYLERIAHGSQRYAPGRYNPFRDMLLACFGRLYATNAVILVQVEYPEFARLADDGFKIVTAYMDNEGKHLEKPKLEDPARKIETDVFEHIWLSDIDSVNSFLFSASAMKDALYLFALYDIPPVMVFGNERCELSGHNREVSIKVQIMGMRENNGKRK